MGARRRCAGPRGASPAGGGVGGVAAIRLRLCLPRGSLPYGPLLGSGLSQLDPGEENSLQRAWALAGEALLGCPGVRVTQVEYHSGTGLWQVWVETPLGAGQVAVPGKEETDG